MNNIVVPIEYILTNICYSYDNDGEDITDFPDKK